MPARKRTLHISLDPVKLLLCIALGIWLGCLAVAATAWFGYRHLVGAAWEQVGQGTTAPLGSPIGPQPAPVPQDNAQMFERYQQNQSATQQRDNARIEEAERLASPKCQFWTAQLRNAPNEKARQNVERFCN
ncbi:hypothetical protein [Pseudomonas tohonis]|uniref:Lipoprotein n=1 Tax=Pseudomonas tohonis TaxID=2725477 RepID=A0ABQ4VUQ7_9PSED|nr:hypothetical protein [Pseudomonas tohonis]GJN50970.1 hypothetical protein TUM20286_07220 [Pseudomonas tohonis]